MTAAPSALLAMALVSACVAPPHITTPTAGATAGSTPTAAARNPSECRLPVAGFSGATDPDGELDQKGTGGFLDLPSGTYTPDPASNRTYLSKSKVWLPVARRAVSTDESTYIQARVSGGVPPVTSLWIVQAKTRAQRFLYSAPPGQIAYVLAFTADGVYVELMPPGGPRTASLLLIDPVAGVVQNARGSLVPKGVINQWWWLVSGDVAWSMEQWGPTSAITYRLVRLDLKDGSAVDWYDSPDIYFVIGLDSSNLPIIDMFGAFHGTSNVYVYKIAAPKERVSITPQGGDYNPFNGGAVTDRHGTWFSGYDGAIWLYSPTDGMRRMATVPPQPGATGQVNDQHVWRNVAGPCV